MTSIQLIRVLAGIIAFVSGLVNVAQLVHEPVNPFASVLAVLSAGCAVILLSLVPATETQRSQRKQSRRGGYSGETKTHGYTYEKTAEVHPFLNVVEGAKNTVSKDIERRRQESARRLSMLHHMRDLVEHGAIVSLKRDAWAGRKTQSGYHMSQAEWALAIRNLERMGAVRAEGRGGKKALTHDAGYILKALGLNSYQEQLRTGELLKPSAPAKRLVRLEI